MGKVWVSMVMSGAGPKRDVGIWGPLTQALTWNCMGSVILGVKRASKRGGGRLAVMCGPQGTAVGSVWDLWGMKGRVGDACGDV